MNMKKGLAIALALVVVIACFAACAGKSEKVEPYAGDLSTVIDTIYETAAPEFMTNVQEVKLLEEGSLNYFLGLGTGEEVVTEGNVASFGVSEAYVSESAFGIPAYSLVVARVNDISKVEEVKTAMFNGINMRKWVCMEADQLRVVACKDIVMLVMAPSQDCPGLVDEIVNAFAGIISGAALVTEGDVTAGNATVALTGEILAKG